MAVEIKLIPMYKVVVYDENGKLCSYSDYALTKKSGIKLGIEIYNDHTALDHITKEILKGNSPKVCSVPHNYEISTDFKVTVGEFK